MSRTTRYTIMPEFAGAYGWINRQPEEGSDYLGPNHACSSGGWHGDHAISPGLEQDYAQWQLAFEQGKFYSHHRYLDLDWPAFHQRGLELTRRLKAELGDAVDIIYCKPSEDPNSHLDGRLRVLADGTLEAVESQWSTWFFSHHVPSWFPRQIVSGGQTGVDRGALDFAIDQSIPHGGWCPKGRKACDGVIPLRYQLKETESAGYRERTRRNVQDNDATLVINSGPLDGGTALTLEFTRKWNKPSLLVQLDQASEAENAVVISQWLIQHQFHTLNVAGPREEKRPSIGLQTDLLLKAVGRVGLPDHFKPYDKDGAEGLCWESED